MMAYPRPEITDRIVLTHSHQMPSLVEPVSPEASCCIFLKTALQVHGVYHVFDPFERCICCRMDEAHVKLQATESCLSFGPSTAAHPAALIEIRVGGCAAVDQPKSGAILWNYFLLLNLLADFLRLCKNLVCLLHQNTLWTVSPYGRQRFY
jgi:hypothetical protein